MEVDRQTGRLTQRLEQNPGGGRFQQARHVLDGDDMSSGLFKLGGKVGIIFEIVFRTSRIQQIAGVADGRLANLFSSAIASIETRIFSTQFRQSKTRKRSTRPLRPDGRNI